MPGCFHTVLLLAAKAVPVLNVLTISRIVKAMEDAAGMEPAAMVLLGRVYHVRLILAVIILLV